MSVSVASPIPVIDLAPFHEGGVAGKLAVAAQVDAACRDLGFLQVIGHGVPVGGTIWCARRWDGTGPVLKAGSAGELAEDLEDQVSQ